LSSSSFFNFRDKDWDIVGKRNYFLSFSGILLVVSILAFGFGLMNNSLNLGLDFTGGTICEIRFDRPATADEVRDIFKDFTIDDIDMSSSIIQQSQSDNHVLIIRTKYLEQDQIEKMYSKLEEKLGHFENLGTSGVGPTVGREVLLNALYAIGVVLVLQLIYITARFGVNWRYGIAVDIALLHDVIIMIGIYCILGLELGSPFLAALLTVIGYSVMDSIVIFDRVRENRLLIKKMPFEKLLNKSILQTMTRSIYTLLTVLICLVCLLLFGGDTLKPFALALFIGVSFGSYSSIFVASPIVVIWEGWYSRQEEEKKAKRRDDLLKARQKGKKETVEEDDYDDDDIKEEVSTSPAVATKSRRKRKKKR